MNFSDLSRLFQFEEFCNQETENVTYVINYAKEIKRLNGSSDILYIGRTEQSIKKRFHQETSTRNSRWNTQQTNIRTTYIYSKIGLENISCFFCNGLSINLNDECQKSFLEKCMYWDKKYYLQRIEQPDAGLNISLEKYLLVTYSDEHLEVPPLNNRM